MELPGYWLPTGIIQNFRFRLFQICRLRIDGVSGLDDNAVIDNLSCMNADFNSITSTNPNYSNDKETTLIIKDTNMIIPFNSTGTNAEDLDEQVFGSLLDDEVEREFKAETEIPNNEFMSMISPEKGSLSAILRSYRSAVSRDCHKI